MIADIKSRIEFMKFEKRLKYIANNIPSYEKFKEIVEREWDAISTYRVKCSTEYLYKVLPLKTLKIESTYLDGVKFITFSKSEFDKVINNGFNDSLAYFFETYYKYDKKFRRLFYKDNKESMVLLLDAIQTKDNEDIQLEIIKILDYLHKEIEVFESDNSKSTMIDIKERLAIEMEFIKKQEEKRKGFDF